MYRIFLLSISIAVLSGCSEKNATLTTVKPEMAGMSSERIDRIKPVMQKYVDENKLPGLITMVARQNKLVHFEKYGLMDAGRPMQVNTIFRLASMTKPITSVAIMILYEEGHFQLDDPVSDYIPEFKYLKVFSSIDAKGINTVDQIKKMTIRDLLLHTSGLTGTGAESAVDSIYREANLSDGNLKDMIRKLSKIPLLYQPGTRWNYSRSTEVLGYLVEVLSGKPFDVFLKERIFQPLKMEDTGFYVPVEKFSRVGAVYAPDPNGIKIVMKPDTNTVSTPVKFLSGNGGLYSTASDYMIFCQMLLNKGEYNGVRILGSKTVDLMTSDQISDDIIMPSDDFFGKLLSGMGFGFGFAVLKDNIHSGIIGSPGSYWWAGSGNTYFYIDPSEEMVIILMTQFVPNYYYPVFKQLRELSYEAIDK